MTPTYLQGGSQSQPVSYYHAVFGKSKFHPQDRCDILPGVNAGASRTAGGIFAGLRHDLFSRGERSTF